MNAAELAQAIDKKACGHGAAWSCRCPAHEDQHPSLSIRDGEGAILLTCHAGCTRADVIAELRHQGLWHPGRSDSPRATPPRPTTKRPDPGPCQTLAPWGLRLWASSCRPIEPGIIAATYLEGRRCALPPPGSDLRWCPDLTDKLSGCRGPALVALVTDVESAEPINLHRTWLQPDGAGKAPIDKPRRLLKGHRSNGVIRLWPDEAVTIGLTIGEGLETCLAAARAGLAPVWATISACNMAAFPVLPGIDGVTLLVDHDRPDRRGRRAGIEAARAVLERYVAAGFDPERDLRVIMSPIEGQDAADLEVVP